MQIFSIDVSTYLFNLKEKNHKNEYLFSEMIFEKMALFDPQISYTADGDAVNVNTASLNEGIEQHTINN